MNRPPEGTRCVDCGCCQAEVYAGNAAICWECDEGVPCRNKTRGGPAGETPVPPMAGEVMAIEEGAVNMYRDQAQKEALAAEPRGTKRGRPSNAMVQRMRVLALEGRSAAEIARETGVTEAAAQRYAEVAAGVPDREAEAEAAVAQDPLLPSATRAGGLCGSPQEPERMTLSLRIDEEKLERWWKKLTLEQKAALVEMQLQTMLEG